MSLRQLFLTTSLFLSIFHSYSALANEEVKKDPGDDARQRDGSAKNVIYFIGDGMGIAAVTSGRIWSKGSEGRLNLEKLSHTGYSKTYSSSDYVTDSAASGTALASGVKTYNGAIGVTDPRLDESGKSRDLQTLTDLAKSMGKSVGIISTARVTHATPACFYAHAKSRDMEAFIATQVEKSGLNLLLGGGRQSFLPAGGKKGRNIIEDLQKSGWKYASTHKELAAVDLTSTDPVLGLFAMDHLAYDLERSSKAPDEPDLVALTEFAISYLGKNPKGYFLMIEGGRIDHAAHENDAKNVVGDMHAFDRAIGYAIDHTDPGESLIVVTADHETGGLAINGYSDRNHSRGKSLLSPIPSQPGEEEHHHLTFASGPHGILRKNGVPVKTDGSPALYYREDAAHTAVDVPVVAGGAGASQFTGFMSNEEIPWKIARAMGTLFTDPVNTRLHLKLEKQQTSS